MHGLPAGADALKKDAGSLPWAEAVPLRHWLGGRLVWHPVLAKLLRHKPNLVIAEQANRNLINYALLARKRAGGPPLALWGHGRNKQAAAGSAGNRFKMAYLNRAHWFFAYTKGVAADVAEAGYPAGRITAVENAVDTAGFSRTLAAVQNREVVDFRLQLGLEQGPVALYCGGMYAEKQIPLLLQAADKVRALVPGFSLLAVGAGPDAYLFEDAAKTRPWLHVLGPKFGHEKALCFTVADVFVMPGLVGLAVLDSFAAGLPVATTTYPFHSPEIEYVVPGENGLVTDVNPEAYAEGLASLLQDPARLATLKAGARTAASYYTLERMVGNFGNGILKAIEK
jgi:glycosyltransferase involved in cell wall biosynthesis